MAKVNPEQVLQREQDAWRYRCQGWTEQRIAAQIGVSQPAVSKILDRVGGRVLRSMERKVARKKAEQTSILEHIVDEALQAWERSKATDVRRIGTKTDSKKFGESTSQSVVSEDPDGDPRYLKEARDAMADIRAIWGIDAPTKFTIQEMDAMIEHELAKMHSTRQDAGVDDSETVN